MSELPASELPPSELPASAEPSLEEQLVAYLDGELDRESARRVEELLASEPKVRQALQQLDRTWQLLDELETTPLSEQFTQSTLEMVALSAAGQVAQAQAEAPRRRRRRGLLLGAGLLGAAVAGFLVVAVPLIVVRELRDPKRELSQNLPVLENIDQYSQVGDIEFLRMLYQERVFAEEGDDGR